MPRADPEQAPKAQRYSNGMLTPQARLAANSIIVHDAPCRQRLLRGGLLALQCDHVRLQLAQLLLATVVVASCCCSIHVHALLALLAGRSMCLWHAGGWGLLVGEGELRGAHSPQAARRAADSVHAGEVPGLIMALAAAKASIRPTSSNPARQPPPLTGQPLQLSTLNPTVERVRGAQHSPTGAAAGTAPQAQLALPII